MAIEAVVACIAGHVVGYGNSISGLEFFHALTHFNHFSCCLMSQDQRNLVPPVPLHNITSTYATRLDLHKQFARTYLRYGHLLKAHVLVAVIHQYAHCFLIGHGSFAICYGSSAAFTLLS